MKIKDRPEFTSKPNVLTMRPDRRLRDAVGEMSRRGYGSVIVTDEQDKLLGVVTERDLMTRVLNEGRDPETTTLGDIMTTEVRAAREDDLVIDWLRIMSNERFRRLPIVDEEGRVVSVMTQGDFVSYTWPELIEQLSFTAKAAIGANRQLAILGAGVGVYTIVLIGVIIGLA